MKEYGYSALGIYFGLSMIDLPLCYLLVHSYGKDEIERYENDIKHYFGYGVDPEEFQRRQQERATTEISSKSKESGILAHFSWTELALAYGIHKSLIFIRLPICAAITPAIVRQLRRWGIGVGTSHISTGSTLLAKNKELDATKFGVRPDRKKRWFSWLF